MESRLSESLSMVLKMRGVPKETKELIEKILDLDWVLDSMDWSDWEDYCKRDLKATLREYFVKEVN